MDTASLLAIVALCTMAFCIVAAAAAILIARSNATTGDTAGGNGDAAGQPGPVSFVGIPAGDSRLNAKGDVPPLVTKSNAKSYEVTFQKGKVTSGSANSDFRMTPTAFFPAEQVRVSFKLWIDDTWPLQPASGQKITGKLAGLFMGQGKASGGNYSSTAASIRVVFNEGGRIEGYFYPQLRKEYSGDDPGWAELDQSQELQKVARTTMGTRIFTTTNDLVIKKGAWNTIEIFVKLNTPGSKNGVLELKVNESKRSLTSVRYRNTPIKIEAFWLQPFFGGGSDEYAPRVTTKAWYTDFKFSKN